MHGYVPNYMNINEEQLNSNILFNNYIFRYCMFSIVSISTLCYLRDFSGSFEFSCIVFG